ncbi:hypothetical protein R5R35_013902 [Gryllus longicercus]|uniref:Out at first protein n=1 Tax=Gryllus longicercus TaxID=2509291 RepID=A0AAN9W3C3_9ORTH
MTCGRDSSCACYVGFFYFLYFINIGNTQLLINVKNQGGDVLQETIAANVSEDAVTLEFQRSDGTLVTQLVDFRNDVQILKALVLGEEERGQSQYQVMCFVCHFRKGDFISSDAMSKLRQKNPGTVRTAEEDRGRDNFTMELLLDVGRSALVSRHVAPLCAEAADATYTREADLKMWATLPGASLSALMGVVSRAPPAPTSTPTAPGAAPAAGGDPAAAPAAPAAPAPAPDAADAPAPAAAEPEAAAAAAAPPPKLPQSPAAPRCLETADLWAPCVCHLELCIGWYPCGLKYCKGKGDAKAAAASSYRCGIKTCKKCSLFAYYVRQKQLCLWDE